MFDRILLATDGSVAADEAQRLAFGLAETCDADLRCLTVAEDPPDYGKPDAEAYANEPFYQAMLQRTEKLARDIARRVAAAARERGLRATGTYRHGRTSEAILDEARDWKANVIVLATHPRHGLEGWLHGSVARKVVAKSRCPVLVCRTEETD